MRTHTAETAAAYSTVRPGARLVALGRAVGSSLPLAGAIMAGIAEAAA